MKPTVGRIVHFYTKDTAKHFNGQREGPYVAVITQTFKSNPDHDTMANLKVLPPFGAPWDQGSVHELAQAEAHGQASMWWVWPPRE